MLAVNSSIQLIQSSQTFVIVTVRRLATASPVNTMQSIPNTRAVQKVQVCTVLNVLYLHKSRNAIVTQRWINEPNQCPICLIQGIELVVTASARVSVTASARVSVTALSIVCVS